MKKEYKYHGEWQRNTQVEPDLPKGTLIEPFFRRGDSGSVDCVKHLDWSIDGLSNDIFFYRVVSDAPITEAQKQEALEEQRRKEGWVVWGMSAECALREHPHKKVSILFVDNDVAFYRDGGYTGPCCAKTGRAFNFQTTAYDLVPYVEKPTMYNIKEGDKYWALSCDKLSNYSWENSEYDKASRSLGLCSRTKEGAEAIRDRLVEEEKQRRKDDAL